MEHSERTIWPYPPAIKPVKQLTWREAAVSMVIVGFMVAIVWPVCAVLRERATFPSCNSNIRQSSLALLVYAQDYDDRLPASKWMDASYMYAKNWDIYACTEVRKSNSNQFGLSFERSLAGAKAVKVKMPESRVLLYDSDLLYKNAMAPLQIGIARPSRHNNKNTIAFLDGHARSLSIPQSTALYRNSTKKGQRIE